jgi:serine/threonine protein kinase
MYPNRDSIESLLKQLGKMKMKERRNNNGAKYFLNICQDIINNHPDESTEEWLLINQVLKDSVAIKSWLKLTKNHAENVVVKIGEYDKIYKDYLRSQLLFENGVNGFVPYICFFTCPDESRVYKKNTNLNRNGFCKNEGPKMSAIVMPFFPEQSLAQRIKENSIAFEDVKRIIIQAMTHLHNAFLIVKFIHRDTHLKNLLIHENNALWIDYGDSHVVKDDQDISNTSTSHHYYNMHLQDYIKILEELMDEYIKLGVVSDILHYQDLHNYLLNCRKNKTQIDFENFLNGIKKMELIESQ